MRQKNDTNIWNVFLNMHLQHSCTENWKVTSKDAEGFFWRVLGSYTHKFPKRSAALLMDLPELCLCLLELCL